MWTAVPVAPLSSLLNGDKVNRIVLSSTVVARKDRRTNESTGGGDGLTKRFANWHNNGLDILQTDCNAYAIYI